jgi:hypothetical protein
MVAKGQGEVATQKCNCFHSPSPQNTTPLLMIQGNIIRQETKFPATHIFVGTSIPITKSSKPIIKISFPPSQRWKFATMFQKAYKD